MSDDDKKPLGLGGGRPSTSRVRQSFSHGRTKSVVVEKKRKRIIVPKSGSAGGSNRKAGGGVNAPGISDAEMERRKKALAIAAAQENERAAKEACTNFINNHSSVNIVKVQFKKH